MGIENKLVELKARIAKLGQTIADKETNDYFLRLPKNWLEDVERKVVPGVETILPLIEQLIVRAEDAVSK